MSANSVQYWMKYLRIGSRDVADLPHGNQPRKTTMEHSEQKADVLDIED
jgi:hypothetical protein